MTKSEKTLLGFITVFLSSVLWPSLPKISLIAFAIIALIFVLILRFSAVVTGMLIGFLWASVCGYYYLTWQLDVNYHNKNLIVEGQVISLQAPLSANSVSKKEAGEGHNNQNASDLFAKRALKFNFIINTIGQRKLTFKPTVRLSWYSPKLSLQQGDKLRLFIRLKPPTGLANPDGFNYQKWLTSKNIAALGYVRQSPSNQVISHNPSIRQRSVNQLLQHDIPNIRWILALSYGDRRLLKQEDWDLMQRTGTAHLFAISGMHLGIVLGFTLLITKGLFYIKSLSPSMASTTNVKPWLLIFPCIMCVGYAFIAGFEIPVMRALITLLLWTLLVVFSKHWRTPNVLLLLLTVFFILFPFAILGISFWLSFIVVLVITLFLWRFKLAANATVLGKFGQTIKLQLFISVVTLPMIAITFSSLPIISFIANFFMIPIITFVLVPLCLVAAIAAIINIEIQVIYWLIDECFEHTFWILSWLDNFSASLLGENWQNSDVVKQSINGLTHPIVIFVLFLIILPPWYRKKSLVFSLLSIAAVHQLMHNKQASLENKSYLYAMDVGQGSALVIRDERGTILYDTGGSFADFSMASSVLLPFFESNNIKTLEYFIVSHLDNDHAGGADVIVKNLEIHHTLSPQKGCNRDAFLKRFPSGITTYLGYSIQILWPLSPISGDENNHSCVIKLQKGTHSILFTGDIEHQSEAAIVSLYGSTNLLNSTILIAPHHGSKTSSSMSFINAVLPQYVVFTSGNNNRWGFPAPSVLNRYKKINAKIYVTGQQGQIKFMMTRKDIIVSTYRDDEYARWFFKAR
ncbi:MAG: competence protein ComEC [Kangiellaceae bacterium]|jgi:competence protein ComEC